MARSFKIYSGEDLSPVYDLSSGTVHVAFEGPGTEAGGRAFRGESTTSTFRIRDEEGRSGYLDVPAGLTPVPVGFGNRVEWLDGPDGDEVRLFRGRISATDYTRGVQEADRAREAIWTCADTNQDLRKIIIDAWSRPEEWDYERVEALRVDYLNGSPRASTVIAGTYISTSNGVLMPAKTYDGTDPLGVLNDIATFATKNFFVTIDDELWYDVWESTVYTAGIRISDRLDEIQTEGTCSSGTGGLVGQGTSNDGNNILSDFPAWSGDREERVEITAGIAVPAGYTLIAFVGTNEDAGTAGGKDHQVYDEQGNTWTRDVESLASGSNDYVAQVWRCNVTNPIAAGDYIRFAVNLGASLVTSSEVGHRSLGVYAVAASLSSPVVGTKAEAFSGSPTVASSAVGDITFAAFDTHSFSAGDPDWNPAIQITNSASPARTIKGSFLSPGTGNAYTGTISATRDWSITTVAYTSGPASDVALTFPPIWDAGSASTFDSIETLTGLRLYYGTNGDYVYVNNPLLVDFNWHSEVSLYTSDPVIDDATKATTLANAILTRRGSSDRTYNVSIGPLSREQIGCIKPGQLIDIKARVIPDAADQFVSRRIAQLRWTSPVDETFFAHLQLDRPIKEVSTGIGPKEAMEVGEQVSAVIAAHTADTLDAHDASAISVLDVGGYYTGTDVEAALQEIGAAGGAGSDLPWENVLDYGADPTGVADSWQAFDDAIASRTERSAAVIVPPGTYSLSAPLVLGNSTVLLGVGSNMTDQVSGADTLTYQPQSVLHFDNNTNGIIAPDDAAVTYRCHHPVLQNLTIKGGGTAQTKRGIWFRDNASSSVPIQRVGLGEVRDCFLEDWGTAIDFDGTADSCKVIGGHVHDCTSGFIGGVSEDVFERVCVWSINGTAVSISGDRGQVIGCELEPITGSGVVIASGADFNRIVANDVKDVTGTAISVAGNNNVIVANTASRSVSTYYSDTGTGNEWGHNTPTASFPAAGSSAPTAEQVRSVGRWEPVTNGVDTFVWDGAEIVVTFVETP